MADNKIETELLSQIKEVLLKFPKYWEKDILLRNKVAEDLRNYNQELIEALLSNQLVKDTYSITLNSTNIFKIEEFISMLRYKNYWENSYTKYSNEIGLTSEGKYLNYNTDVVLDFPHKDSVLEGGMTKEDQGKQEVYYHNVLAKEEIDTLLYPKVLTNIKKYDKNGEHDIDDFTDKDNLIIKGNNLVALHSLKEIYENKIKMIYIDPPYNTGNDTFKYNDKFNRSTWLTFIQNRLNVAYKLLKEDGVIFVHCDDNEQAYLKVLMDKIFEESNFVATLPTVMNLKGNQDEFGFAGTHEYIVVYAKNKMNSIFYDLQIDDPDELEQWEIDSVGYYKKGANLKATGVNAPREKRPNLFFPIYISSKGTLSLEKNNNEDFELLPITDGKEMSWRWQYSTMKKNIDDIIVVGSNDNYSLYKKQRPELGDLPTKRAKSVLYKPTYSSGNGTNQLRKLFGDRIFNYPKPEELIKDLIQIGSDVNDIVLDFFMGSSTTQAVAHKMGRQYIGIEQMDYINTVSVPRLQKVIEGEQGGISKDVDWEGGGSFIYAELLSLNDEYVKDIQASRNEDELEKVLSNMKERAYLNFKVDLEKVSSKEEGYKNLSLEEKKEILIQVLDMNQLYLSYSEIEDEQYKIPEDVKAFNHSFYQKEGEDNE